jgi:hypothetical protein
MHFSIRDVSPRETSGGFSGIQVCNLLQETVWLLAIGELDMFLF